MVLPFGSFRQHQQTQSQQADVIVSYASQESAAAAVTASTAISGSLQSASSGQNDAAARENAIQAFGASTIGVNDVSRVTDAVSGSASGALTTGAISGSASGATGVITESAHLLQSGGNSSIAANTFTGADNDALTTLPSYDNGGGQLIQSSQLSQNPGPGYSSSISQSTSHSTTSGGLTTTSQSISQSMSQSSQGSDGRSMRSMSTTTSSVEEVRSMHVIDGPASPSLLGIGNTSGNSRGYYNNTFTCCGAADNGNWSAKL